MSTDDPLDRLSAEDDWAARAKRVERRLAREVRRARRRQRRLPRGAGRRSTLAVRGVSPIFLTLVAVTLVSGGLLWAGAGPPVPAVLAFVIFGWLVSLCLHEFAHAVTAHRGGDHTVVAKGYLRLDPRRYSHPLLTFVLPLFFLVIGGIPLPGAAVQIESHRLRNRFRDALVSAAGPAVNIGAAIVLLAGVAALGPAAIYDLDELRAPFWAALTFLAYVQLAVAILNLLPVPGLDGYGMIEPYLPPRQRRIGNLIRPFGFLLLVAVLFFTPARHVFTTVCGRLVDLSGAPVNGAYFGYELFRFWANWW